MRNPMVLFVMFTIYVCNDIRFVTTRVDNTPFPPPPAPPYKQNSIPTIISLLNLYSRNHVPHVASLCYSRYSYCDIQHVAAGVRKPGRVIVAARDSWAEAGTRMDFMFIY